MSIMTSVETKPALQLPYTPRTRLVAAAFVNSVPFAGETASVQLGRNCDSILPARLDGDGAVALLEKGQQPTGLLIKRNVHDRTTNERYVDQVFVPFANVRGIQYGK